MNKHKTTLNLYSFLLLTISLLVTSCGKNKQDQERVQLEKEIKELNDRIDKELQALKPDDKSTNHDPDALDDIDRDKVFIRGMEIAQLEKWLKQQKSDNQGLAEKIKDAEAQGKNYVDITLNSPISLQEAKNKLKVEEIIPLKIEVKKKELELAKLKK